jgi:2-phospho-L-lactate/phosphoenolpyruvate guanylyltransferase
MKALLIPVKSLADAKQRLAPHFTAAERVALADALWRDFFDVVARLPAGVRVFVISAEPCVLERARTSGWEAIEEARQSSESDSVDFASRWCEQRGVTALLRLPVDLPALEPADIVSLLDGAPPAPGVLLAPSRDATGTNALLRTPPTLFPSHFGRGSFAKHLEEARRCHARVEIVRNPAVELDVDDLDDLRAGAPRVRRDSALAAWLGRHCPSLLARRSPAAR